VTGFDQFDFQFGLAQELRRRAGRFNGRRAQELDDLAVLIHTEDDPDKLIRWTADAAEVSRDGATPRSERQADDGEKLRIVTVQEFAAVDEPGAESIVGTRDQTVIPEGGDVMAYGDGGASKTTLTVDLGCHLAAGDDWLGFEVPKARRVLLIEAEGVRPKFRDKLRHKLDAWHGSDLGDRLSVLERPWAKFRFPTGDEVAEAIGEREVDVLIVGPLRNVGWDELGTMQQVRDFMETVDAFRRHTGRRLTVVLIHHENKGGKVSGAWEGAGDTLLHAEVHKRGETVLTIQKAKWASEWHRRRLKLEWVGIEGFEVVEEEERDLDVEITIHLTEKGWRTAPEIAAPRDKGGIGANVDDVKTTLKADSDKYEMRTGPAAKALGRKSNAQLWGLK
jgi:hypothetical protein